MVTADEVRISDERLEDWYRRWPSTLPTSVPHEQVRMLIENLRDCRAQLAEMTKALEGMQIIAELWRSGHDRLAACVAKLEAAGEMMRDGASSHAVAAWDAALKPDEQS
jgi:hypothetical protein